MPPVSLRTARLVLDRPSPDDVDVITLAGQDPPFERYPTIPWPNARDHAGLGSWAAAPHRGQGFMAEAVRAGVDRAFDLAWPTVTWQALVGDHAAAATARNVGLAFAGIGPGVLPRRDGSTSIRRHRAVTPETDPAAARSSWPAETCA
ncbi:GNAT family N-acetyltransferase [Agromyces larvae]|uniref:GNAT family N-acetyltransferase n=1 Tax=Agromyces larvae TaxID=2929802 RepID=A0ABY4C340_9MICO|nr:GNAT family protein [Agromyces larvae]UOE44441.1 GNAT family N-acetyltransferase [Agromyces larvae]